MKTIAFTAQSFGFGPVRKMIAISEKLDGVYKIFFGSGVAYDLAKAHFFHEYHHFEHSEEREIYSLLNRSDVFINVMDFELATIAKKSNCQCVVVDSLLWFYSFRPDVDYATYYFVQKFFRSSHDKLEQYSIKNAHIVAPIIEEHTVNIKKINQCIINFGGSDGKVCTSHITVGKNTNYPFIILQILLPLLSKRFKHILVVGRQHVITMCQKKFPIKNVFFRMLDSQKMLYELSRSQTVFSVPGIHSFLDAANKLPIFFLPPSNHSHQENLKVFIEHKITESYFSWTECYSIRFNNGMSRQQKIEMILQTIERFGRDLLTQKELQKKIRNFLGNESSWSQITALQTRKLESLGNDGLQTIVDKVQELISPKCTYIHNSIVKIYNN